MPVASMTGFARFEGESDGKAFVWELRSVNGKGLDLRLRMPPGLETLEAEARRLAASRLSRGNVQIALTSSRIADAPAFSVNEAMLAQVLALSDRLVAAGHAVTPTADGILSIRGIIDVAPSGDDPAGEPEHRASVLAGLTEAIALLAASREAEGSVLKAILEQRLDEIASLADRAEADPSRTTEAIGKRLSEQVVLLMGTGADRLDPARLHQEVAILAAKADIREELDRLRAHVAAARALLGDGGPVGRKLDFLSQEFNRESNTICSKSNATSLTALGLEMKLVVDQFREQAQNVE